MATECYAMVRGSSLRITELDKCGGFSDAPRFATAKCVSKVMINEVTAPGSNEALNNPDEEKRLRFIRSAQTIRHTVDINFLRVDPGVLSLVAGVQLVSKGSGDGGGFGEGGFGYAPFGGSASVGETVVGFDSGTRLKPVTFALEIWSKLAGQRCEGLPAYGYTLFPYLKGGRLSGFTFANGLVSFNLVGAQTRKGSGWGAGPYDLGGPFERLTSRVSRNTSWRQFVTSAAPPGEMDGIQAGALDVIDNGTAANPMPDPTAPLTVSGGGAVTSPYIISGGRA